MDVVVEAATGDLVTNPVQQDVVVRGEPRAAPHAGDDTVEEDPGDVHEGVTDRLAALVGDLRTLVVGPLAQPERRSRLDQAGPRGCR